MKNKISDKQWFAPLAVFSAVGALYMLYYALRGFYPFGERSIAWCDMEQQFLPLMMEVRNAVLEGGSVLLGKGGGGMNFWGVFLFFVSSPFVLLSLLVSEDKIIYFVNLLTVLKACLCGVSAQFYFQRMFPKMSRSFGVLMSIMYAFSGCIMMYYQNNMWLELMMLFPLLLLSMFRLCEKGKWGAYVLCLSVAMYLNFYISFMYIIFIVISGGLMLIFCCEEKRRKDRAVKLIIGDICAAMISAFVWIPAFRQFTSSGRGSSSAGLFFGGSFFGNVSDKAALLACTSIVFAALAMIFLERKRLRSGKGAYFSIITVIMMVGAFIDPINKIWHTGSYQAFPFRYGFMIVLTAMSVCGVLFSERKTFRTVTELKERRIRIKVLLLTLLFAAAAVPVFIYSDKLDSYVDTLWTAHKDAIILTALALLGSAVYLVCIRKYCSGALKKRFVLLIMSFITITESMLSFNVYFGNVTDVSERFAQAESLNDKIDDDEFYRVKNTKRYFYSNMLEGMGFSSISHYTSLTDSDFLFAAKRLGYSSYWMDSSANGGTTITDAFLMNRYFFGMTADMNAFCELYNGEGVLKIYRNILSGNGAVISPASPDELSGFTDIQRMDSTVYIADKLYGAEGIAEIIEPYAYDNLELTEDEYGMHFAVSDASEEASVIYNLSVDGRKELYFDIFGSYSTSLSEPYFNAVNVEVNGRTIETDYPNKRANGIIDLGTFENDDNVSVRITVNKDFSAGTFGLYMLDADKAEECIRNTPTAAISLDGNKIRITADSDTGGYVYIPFAYNDGYSAELNGEKAELHKVLGSFMAAELKDGENELVLTFCPPGLRTGVVISVIGILLFVLLMLLRPKTAGLGRIMEAMPKILTIASIAAVIVIYAAVPIFWIVFKLLF